MNKFWEITKKPLRIGVIAAVLYIIDALIAGLFVEQHHLCGLLLLIGLYFLVRALKIE